MFRLLVVEDQVEFYQDYLLRLFEKLLPMENISITHVPSLDAALVALANPWDFILMDYSLGPKTDFMGDAIRDGGDLISFRRAVEADKGLPTAYIMGISSNQVGNRLMEEKGANNSTLKLNVVDMANLVKKIMAKEKAKKAEAL